MDDLSKITKAFGELASEHQVVTTWVGTEVYNKVVAPFLALFVDEYKLRAKGRLDRFWNKTGPMMPNPENPLEGIPDRILVPAMQVIAVEDDTVLQDMWASLLVNAANGKPEAVRPAFISILQQMASDEAALLEQIRHTTLEFQEFDRAMQHQPLPGFAGAERQSREAERLAKKLVTEFASQAGETVNEKAIRFDTCVQTLAKAGLIVPSPSYVLTGFGHLFLRCITSSLKV